MEETSEVMRITLGVKPYRSKRPLESRNFTMDMAPSRFPLGSAGSFQVWKKPYLMKLTETSSSSSTTSAGEFTKAYYPEQDLDIIPNSTSTTTSLLGTHDILNEDHKSRVENASPDNEIPISSCNGLGAISRADNDITRSSEESENMVNINGVQFKLGRKIDPNMDPRKLKRIIFNRVSAQKSRMKKLQYVSAMENKAKALETQIAVLSPQVALYKNQQHVLQIEQKSLSHQISVSASSGLLKDVEIEANKAEVNRLRQVLQFKLQQQHLQSPARVLKLPPEFAQRLLMDQIPYSGLRQSGFKQYYSNQGAEEGENSGSTTTQLNHILIKQLNMRQQLVQDDQKTGQARTADDLAVAPDCNWELIKQNMAAGTELHNPNSLGAIIIDHQHENMLNIIN
ncbi:Basic-leucine zipper domain containing protein [Parasponia andersonii]|uniref:Basic-leucine zipper domain containing protein n=1 Tax=Parasponia andersonii TaxID=3476 RepID=A0A2P5C953_PARAD|nr:Basic-leucine zipper domain containing protein [Parasponia andersonii]